MKILIVDDNPINVMVFDNLLTKVLQCETQCFTSSIEALDWATRHSPDLLITDYQMPDMNGLELIQQFRSIKGHSETPVIMVTATEDKKIRYRALELGANDFLNKPIDKAELIARTRNMLTIRQNQKALADRASWLADEVKKATQEIIAREREVILRLSKAAEYRSPETGTHVMRVAYYSKALSKKLGLSEEEQDLILMAAPMHDIGKVGIPDEILYKNEKLDEYEYAHMKLHTLTGYEIMQNSQSRLLQMASEIALCHHEKFDGTGYPRALKGDQIPLSARICAISDVFDALTSERPYKKAWSIDEAMLEIERNSTTHFDPKLVEAFKTILPEIEEIRMRFTSGGKLNKAMVA
ncbi:response regulator [bacterium]|nr:response regulator [bacterium]